MSIANLPSFEIVVAVDAHGGIGKNNALPWPSNKEDMNFFRKLTTGHIVIMGNNTYKSLPDNYRPLPKRVNIVLTRSASNQLPAGDTGEKPVYTNTLYSALHTAGQLRGDDNSKKIFVIGGANVYAQAIKLPSCVGCYVTKLAATYDCDVFVPDIVDLMHSSSNIQTVMLLSEGQGEIVYFSFGR